MMHAHGVREGQVIFPNDYKDALVPVAMRPTNKVAERPYFAAKFVIVEAKQQLSRCW